MSLFLCFENELGYNPQYQAESINEWSDRFDGLRIEMNQQRNKIQEQGQENKGGRKGGQAIG